MKAVGYTHCHPVEHPEALIALDLLAPVAPKGRDLLVEIRAVSVNPVDTKVRRRDDPVGEPKILGYDAAGVVRAIGPDCTLFGPGDAVFYAGVINRSGTNAELHLVDERIVGRKPKTLSFGEAAALPLTAITAWEGLFDRLAIPRDPKAGLGLARDARQGLARDARQGLARDARQADALLVIGGAGGVGSMVIQLARMLTGLTVIATASRAETRDWCKALGAHHIVDHKGDIAAQMKALGVKGARYVFSTNTTERNWKQIVEAVAPQGKVLLIESAAQVDARDMMRKSVSIHWELMFTRALFGTPDMIEQHNLLNEVALLVEAGRVRHTATKNLGAINAENLRAAHALVESGTMIGKVVLEGF